MTYNPADWKPGDVAMVTTWGGTYRAELSRSRNWCWRGGVTAESTVTDARPLVVLDPESDEDMERLRREYDRHLAASAESSGTYVSAEQRTEALRAALRSLTRPPKPDEPKGRAAVVVTRGGETWSRVDTDAMPWRLCGDPELPIVFAGWGDLDVPPDGVKFGGVS